MSDKPSDGGEQQTKSPRPVRRKRGTATSLRRVARPRVPRSTPTVPLRSEEADTSWLREVATGIVKTLVLFGIASVLVRLGLQSVEPLLAIDFFDPRKIVDSVTGLVIQLSTINEYLLLGGAALLTSLTLVVGALWLRYRSRPAIASNTTWLALATRELCDRQSVLLLAGAALIALSAFGYQRVLWSSILRVPEGRLGIAIISDADAAALAADLQSGLENYGDKGFALRPLPVRMDYRRPERIQQTAVTLGSRIGARVVLLHRPGGGTTARDGQPVPLSAESGEAVRITIVFTNPDARLAIRDRLPPTLALVGSEQSPLDAQPALDMPPTTVPDKPDILAPELHSATDDLQSLIAAAAGIVRYHEGNFPRAITLLERARMDAQAPRLQSQGVIEFFLGSAYAQNAQPEAARVAYDRGIDWFEQQSRSLEVQEELVLVKIYLERGLLEGRSGHGMSAISWYERALGERSRRLHAEKDALLQPLDVNATYARVYGLLADAHRGLGNESEAERIWQLGAGEVAQLAQAAEDTTDISVRLDLARARYALGDCGPALSDLAAILASNPDHPTAVLEAAAVEDTNGRTDLARERLQRATEGGAGDSAAAWRGRGALEFRQAIGFDSLLQEPHRNYFEPSYLAQAETSYGRVLEIDETDIDAHRALGDIAHWRAIATIDDLNAHVTLDEVGKAKARSWIERPEIWEDALNQYGQAISHNLAISETYDSGRPADWVRLVTLFQERQDLRRQSFRVPETAALRMADIEANVLADGADVRTWADHVLSPDAQATPEQKLQVLANVVATVETERWWFRGLPHDEQEIERRKSEERQLLDEAMALIQSSTLETPLDFYYAGQLYALQASFARTVEGDEDAASAAEEQARELDGQMQKVQGAVYRHQGSICRARQFLDEGLALWDRSPEDGGPDQDEARRLFEEGLKHDPTNTFLLDQLGWLAYAQGDVERAVSFGQRAADTDPDDATLAWSLAVYELSAGDDLASEAALDRFFDLAATSPRQERFSYLRAAIMDLSTLRDRFPENEPQLLAAAERIEEHLGTMASEERGVPQYATLYARLGQTLFLWEYSVDAERLLRHALELDGHQPRVRLGLLMTIGNQGRTPEGELDHLLADLYHPMWYDSGNSAAVWSQQLEADLDWMRERFPAQGGTIDMVREVLDDQGISGTTFTHPTFEYSVTWDDSWPDVLGPSTPDTGGELVLSNPVSWISFRSRTEDQGDPETCIARSGDAAARGYNIAGATAVRDKTGGAPADGDRPNAWSLIDLTLGDGTALRLYTRCWTLVPGSVTLQASHMVFASDYEEQVDERERVFASLTLPDGEAMSSPATPPALDAQS